ncbi:MAG: FtsX-like permease family protein [Bacteroidota bacterium]
MLILRTSVKLAFRVLLKQRVFTIINLICLSVSLLAFFITVLFVQGIYSFDVFHNNLDQIYRVNSTEMASSPASLKSKLEDYPIVSKIAPVKRGFWPIVVLENGESFMLKGLEVDGTFFEIFSFEGLLGNAVSALNMLNNLVLTESSAKKIFNKVQVLNKVVRVEGEAYTIGAVVKDPPKNSHFQFEILGSFITQQTKNLAENEGHYESWNNRIMYHNFILIDEKHHSDEIDQILREVSSKENSKEKGKAFELYSQPMKNIVLSEQLFNESGITIDKKAILLISVLSLIVILIACFNYSNLSFAMLIKRKKEIGIMKIFGGTRRNIASQLLLESIIITVASALIAFIIYVLLRPHINALLSGVSEVALLDVSFNHFLTFIGLASLIGVVSAFFPAWLYSKISSLKAISGGHKLRLSLGLSTKSVLVALQFCVSIFLMIATTVIYRQYNYALDFDLGFISENILNIELWDEGLINELENEFAAVPGVTMISKSKMLPSRWSLYSNKVVYLDFEPITVYENFIDHNYLENFGHRLVSGHNFRSGNDKKEESSVIIDQLLAEKIGFIDPNDALGKKLNVDGNDLTIIGVVKDFMNTSILHKQLPLILRNSKSDYYVMNLKFSSNDHSDLIEQLEAKWRSIDEKNPFEADIYDHQIAEVYKNYDVMLKISGALSIITIAISVLGLLGMVIYSTETRIKELSIRRVLGADTWRLLGLISGGFLSIFGAAFLLASSLAYFVLKRYFLSEFTFHVSIDIMELFASGFIVPIICFLLMHWQISKVVNSNPTETLRHE